jgi:hypothetical protein
MRCGVSHRWGFRFLLASGLATAAFVAAPSRSTCAAEPDAAALWKEVLALDSGPERSGSEPSPVEVFARHLKRQEAALRRFLELSDPGKNRFEAELRLARVLALRAEQEVNADLQKQAAELLDRLEQNATREQQAHVAFTRICQWMRQNRSPDSEKRADLLAAVREFRERFAFDPRTPSLLVEVATRFDREPNIKESLLSDARSLARDPKLKLRIADDLMRLSLLGRELKLSFSEPGGRVFSLEKHRGQPVLIFFFSSDSASSLVVWRKLNAILAGYPRIRKLALSLDETRLGMDRVRQELGGGWIFGWEAGGWKSPLARRWGINAVPSALLLDSKGKVFSINALDGVEEQLRAVSAGQESR